jgi:hypothetical protein
VISLALSLSPGKVLRRSKKTVQKVYGDKAFKRIQIYHIMKKVKEGKPAADERGFNTKRRIRNLSFIADIAAEVESDRRVTVRIHGMSTGTIHATLHDDLNLSKMSARWVPKLLSDDMKKERVRTSEEFLRSF